MPKLLFNQGCYLNRAINLKYLEHSTVPIYDADRGWYAEPLIGLNQIDVDQIGSVYL